MKFSHRFSSLLLASVCMMSTPPLLAQGVEPQATSANNATPSVDEIVHRTNHVSYFQGKDGRAQVQMVITDDQGRSRQRSFTILRRDRSDSEAVTDHAYLGEQQLYVYFNRPADVNKMVFMVHKKRQADDDRWLYLPALDLVKRIAASDKRTSFVGSDYFYEDVSGRSVEEDTHELLRTTDNYYVLRHTPKDPDSVEFAYYDMYVHKQSFIPVQVEFFDKNNSKYRVSRALKVDDIDGYPTVTEASMENLNTGSKTLMRYSQVRYNIGLPDDVFTERYLRTPPRQYLR
ncbi:outer membrane lipoprotein-sorting protein [Aestuariicella hydrocarbonica]|uniref:Outer membrane lipoprotein-sorting protein n=1 Tax=Pseudomaricurvus hydrocarbonicus TaxID=1470433 RepID=A0A9E5JW19_9GAMM|nr:outer membrane lipoprotein-sorting protein [Aestuariicella hydrocarbonica]NHO65935.1 outer membrane lipoprotein-sorting protein [Aestuariicella hydrocarbonica]